MRFVVRALTAFVLILLFAASAWAQPTPASKPAGGEAPGDEVTLVIFNRPVVVFRSSFLGASPKVRADRARFSVNQALDQGGPLVVSVKGNPEGQLVMIDDRLAFVVTGADADPLQHEDAKAVAAKAARQLEQIISETRESRNLRAMLKALGFTAVASLVFALLVWGVQRLRRWLDRLLVASVETQVRNLKIGGTQIVEGHQLVPFLQRLLSALRWLVILLLAYEWLSFVLSAFPYTRSWGERLNDYLLDVVGGILHSILGAIPGLGVALAIFLVARLFIGFLGRFLERLVRAGTQISWLSPQTMPTSRRLFSVGIWLFAVAMAYPYLPGAETDAFKGLSVLLGLMVSIGASSIVGQGAAGLILTYTGTIRVGEYVRIGENEGTVVKLGMFTTTVRTGLGEELTLPNSMITGAVTKNYSRTVRGAGFIVDTTVTIGYDTPWRQVEAMLVEAAKRTPGIIEAPAPAVFQTALSDYYPEYRLVAQAVPSQPRPRAEVLTLLHANIQDVFNEHGVQIMSPHYMGDPQEPKVVKPEDWFPSPAKRNQ
ncbi:MAG: mechanosensitive ion channel family protein [Burkholderiaceae bacterium]|nr:mechanosensitive ion channel family protein [Burkholderiaceae bacterium]